MATYSLVNIQDDLGPLVKLSLAAHHVPVKGVFDVFEEATGERFVAVATPIADEKGDREAYFKIFTALNDELFATAHLRLHTLVLSAQNLNEIRRLLKKGVTEVYLPKLAHLGEVIVRPTENPAHVLKSGVLIVSRLANGSFQLKFNPIDKHLSVGSREFETVELMDKCLKTLRVETPDNLDRLGYSHSASIVLSASLEDLYTQGLIRL